MAVREDEFVMGDVGDGLGADLRRWKALFVLALVQFMIIIDITVVNVALPSIQRSLHFTGDSLAWVVDGYALMAGGLFLLACPPRPSQTAPPESQAPHANRRYITCVGA
jgi:hypothetical protein